MSKLIVGCGYVGLRLARHWVKQGKEVWATTRSLERAAELSAFGLRPLVLDVTQETKFSLPDVETVVFAVGYDRTGPHQIEEVYVDGLRRVADSCSASVSRFVYLSSTGVYGQTTGEWVDEESPCEPVRDGGKACLAAEHLLREHPTLAEKAIVLRLAGIYGPDRLPQAKLLMRGEPLPVAAEGQLNLIHVDDIVQIVDKCDTVLSPPQLLCVSDGHAVRRAEFYKYLAQLLNCEPPRFTPPVAGSSQAARARGSKRIRNTRLQALLNPDWAYPTYREGLASIVSEQGST